MKKGTTKRIHPALKACLEAAQGFLSESAIEELKETLIRYELFEAFILPLQFTGYLKSKGKQVIIPIDKFDAFSNSITSTVGTIIGRIKSKKEKSRVQKCIGQFSAILIQEMVRVSAKSGNDSKVLKSKIDRGIETSVEFNGFKKDDVYNALKHQGLDFVSAKKSEGKKPSKKSSEERDLIEIFNYVSWSKEQKKLIILEGILIDFGYLLREKSLQRFFNFRKGKPPFVKWKKNAARELAFLIKQLKEKDLIEISSKAFWRPFEIGFIDSSGEKISKDLAQIYSKLQTEKDRKNRISKQFEEIFEDMERQFNSQE